MRLRYEVDEEMEYYRDSFKPIDPDDLEVIFFIMIRILIHKILTFWKCGLTKRQHHLKVMLKALY